MEEKDPRIARLSEMLALTIKELEIVFYEHTGRMPSKDYILELVASATVQLRNRERDGNVISLHPVPSPRVQWSLPVNVDRVSALAKRLYGTDDEERRSMVLREAIDRGLEAMEKESPA
jgi:hypothetical protein